MVQLWVNLPAKYKMTTPKYQEITHAMMGNHVLADNKGVIEVIAGEYKGTKGPASTFTPMHVYNARLKKGAKLELNFPSNYNTGLLVVEGSACINGEIAPADHFVLFKNDGELITIEATEDAICWSYPANQSMNHCPIWSILDEYLGRSGESDEDVSAGKFGVLENS